MLVPQSLSLCNIFGVRCALPPSPVAVPRTVYGNDDRRDWYELDYTSAGDAMAGRLLANSIMVHITRADLGAPDSHGIYRILDDYADSLRLGPVRNMCDGQKFLRQPRLGYCSATLVSPTGVITAGHCVPDQKTCDSAAYVFNYYVTGHDAHGDPTFPLITSDDVYFCKSVSTMYATGGTDIAHITLDRPVLGRVPATYRKTLVPTTPGQKLMMIGFPDGMPAKVEAGGTVTDAGRSNGFEFFVASTDSFGGNSGSGIFDADGMMIGVLVRGIKGYVQSGGCTVVYALPGPRGQEVERIIARGDRGVRFEVLEEDDFWSGFWSDCDLVIAFKKLVKEQFDVKGWHHGYIQRSRLLEQGARASRGVLVHHRHIAGDTRPLSRAARGAHRISPAGA